MTPLKMRANIPWHKPGRMDKPLWHAVGANGRGVYYLWRHRWRVWISPRVSPYLYSRRGLKVFVYDERKR